MRFLLILEQKVKSPGNVNTVFMLAVICPVCPFIAQEGSLRNRNKFDVLTEDDKPLQILVKNPVFLYFAVDDPFNSEMNATPALISRCPFHIRVQTRMGPCEAKAPKVVKCADCVTNSFASHLCFWLVAELLPWKPKKMFLFMLRAWEIFCAQLVAYSQTNCICHLHISHNTTFLLPKTLQNL